MTISPYTAASLTTGTQTVSELVTLFYESLVLCCILGFAAYDIYTKRVPDRALVFFCPVALVSLPVHMGAADAGTSFLTVLGLSLAGCASGFLLLLAAAMLSKNGTGLGGGDIKLAAIIGFIYGPYRILEILMLAALLCGCSALVIGCRRRDKTLSIPFVPFIAAGSLATLIASIL